MSEAKSLPLPMSRNLYFSKQVDQESMENLTKAIIKINESDRILEKMYQIHDMNYIVPPIKIFIDSYGGLVYQCFGLLGVMNKSLTPIHTYVTGAAMSCGFMILIHGHKRFAYEHSTPLYHQVSSGVWGTTKSIEEELKETKRLQKKIEQMTLNRTKIGKKKLKKIYKRKIDWFMTAKEALKLGVVDEIV